MTPTPFTMRFDFGDVVLVPFPFTNQAGVKQRPAVVVSSAEYADARPDIVIMAITSQVRPVLGHADYVIADWQGAGLLKASLVKPVLATIEQSLVRRVLGRLADADSDGLRGMLRFVLGPQSAGIGASG